MEINIVIFLIGIYLFLGGIGSTLAHYSIDQPKLIKRARITRSVIGIGLIIYSFFSTIAIYVW